MTAIPHFTPSLMSHENLEAIFVQREKLAQRIVEVVRESATTQSKHYRLLIGSRGVGKTHLVSLIYHRVRAIEDLRDRLLIAWLREEEWGVTSFLDLLLRIFRAIKAELDRTDLNAGRELESRLEPIFELSPEAAERVAGNLLKEYVGDRTLLILCENLDDMFAGLEMAGQQRLRAYLQENPFCTIVATAQRLFNGVSLQTSPFYGFFRIDHLQDLTRDEAVQLLAKIARLKNDRELESFIQSPTGRSRIRALQHLAGGNHRVYVIFSQFLTRESLDELQTPFIQMLNDLTPYYQARMAWLSPQQRKIVEFLIDRRGAVTVKEIAQRCFMTHQTASGQLKGLKDMGYVQSETIGRESYYELLEPLMRFCIEMKKSRGEPIRLFVDFLRIWYTQNELTQLLSQLQFEKGIDKGYILKALQQSSEESEDPRVSACLRDYKASFGNEEYESALQVAEELMILRNAAEDWFNRSNCLFLLRRFEEALIAANKAIELFPEDPRSWFIRSVSLFGLARFDEAVESLDKTLNHKLPEQFQEVEPIFWYVRGGALRFLNRWEEALASFDCAIKLDPNNSSSWNERGVVLGYLNRQAEALASFTKAIEIDSTDMRVRTNQAASLTNLGETDEALRLLNAVIEADGTYPISYFVQAVVLLSLNRWEEGSTELDKALSRFGNAENTLTNYTKPILQNLFANTNNSALWNPRISSLIEIYTKHGFSAELGEALAQSISALNSPMVSDTAAQLWLEIWQNLTQNRPEFQLPLRLLDAAVRYRATKDGRILMELPIEERSLLAEVLETKPLAEKKAAE